MIALLSIDVGGTLGTSSGPTLTSRLMAASPLERARKVRIIREQLHATACADAALIRAICSQLEIDADTFGVMDTTVLPITLFAGTLEALDVLSQLAPLVTLSNVTSLESEPDELKPVIGRFVSHFFRSCDLGYAKPDPRIFAAVADICKVPVDGIMHIGDDWECDVIGALDAGASATWIARGRDVPDAIQDQSRVMIAESLFHASQLLSRSEGRTTQ